MTRGTKGLNEVLEETIYSFGDDIDFDGLSKKRKKLIASYAIRDPRFDLYEILTEREIDITEIIKKTIYSQAFITPKNVKIVPIDTIPIIGRKIKRFYDLRKSNPLNAMVRKFINGENC